MPYEFGKVLAGQSYLEVDLHFPLPQLEQLIRGIPVVQLTRLSDSFVWPHNNGVCLVSSASKFLYQQAQVPFNSSQRHWI